MSVISLVLIVLCSKKIKNLLIQFELTWGNFLVILGLQYWHAKSIPLPEVWMLLSHFESVFVCFQSICHVETMLR